MNRLHEDPAVRLWMQLMAEECAELRIAAGASDPRDVASVEQLRKHWPADLVTAAIQLMIARGKAARKFRYAERLVADPAGVEQATSEVIATHKARRFAERGVRTVHDLCCGIGGDAMALASVCEVLAVDSMPLRAWMTQCNARCSVMAARVEDITLSADAVHIDPSRRCEAIPSRGRRRIRFQEYSPGPAFIESVLNSKTSVAVKLGPGVELSEVPRVEDSEVEFISEQGTLVQAVLWSGELSREAGRRTATQFPSGCQMSGKPSSVVQCVAEAKPRRFIFAVDPAIERAGLLAMLIERTGTLAIHERIGLLTSDALIDSPWLSGFELHAHMPWRVESVQRWLREHDGGIVEVKTRGKVVDTDVVQKKLRGQGPRPFTVFVLRQGSSIQAYVASRVPRQSVEERALSGPSGGP